jgi:hypothetical protein
MTIFGKFFKWVSTSFFKLDTFSKKCIPVAVDVVEKIKNIMENPTSDVVLDVIKGSIQGTADDIIIDKAHAHCIFGYQ